LLFGKENWQRTGEAGAALFGLAKKLGRKIKLDKPGRIQTYTLLPKEEPKPAAKQPTAQALRVAVAKRTAKAKQQSTPVATLRPAFAPVVKDSPLAYGKHSHQTRLAT